MKITNQAHLAFISSSLNRFKGYDLENDWEIKDQLKKIFGFDISQRIWKQACSVLKDNSKTVNDLQAIIFTGGKAAPGGWASKLLELIGNRMDFLVYRNKIDSMKPPDSPLQAEVINLETYIPGAALLRDARKLLELTMRLDADDRPIPELPVDLMKLWKEKSKSWDIIGHTYNFGGIRQASLGEANDFYGNNPANIFLLRHNKHKDVEVYLGPADIRTLYPSEIFPQEVQLIDSLQKEKQTEQKNYKQKINNMILVRGLISDSNDDKNIKERLLDLSRRDRTVGDKEYEFVDSAYDYVSLLWDKKYSNSSPGTKLEDFFTIVENLEKVIQYCRNVRKLDGISKNDLIKLKQTFDLFRDGQIPPDEDVRFLIELNDQLLDFQKLNLCQDSKWAVQRTFVDRPDQGFARPAHHANLRTIRELDKWFGDKSVKIADLGCGSSGLYGQAKGCNSPHAQNIVSIDKQLPIFQNAPSGKKVVIADLSKLQNNFPVVQAQTEVDLLTAGSFDVADFNFVLDLMKPEEMKASLIAAMSLLKPALIGVKPSVENLKDFPVLIIGSPENSPIDSSPIADILRVAGFTKVLGVFENNELTDTIRAQIDGDRGTGYVNRLERLTQKPYHLNFYIRTSNVTPERIRQIRNENFTIRAGSSRESGNGTSTKTLNPDLIDRQQKVAALNSNDFICPSHELVSREEIINQFYNEATSVCAFEVNLAVLKCFQNYLSEPDKKKLQEIDKLWNKDFVLFLRKEQVDFVRDKVLNTIVKYDDLPEHLKGRFESTFGIVPAGYALTALEQQESEYIYQHPQRPRKPTIWEEFIQPLEMRIASVVSEKFKDIGDKIAVTVPLKEATIEERRRVGESCLASFLQFPESEILSDTSDSKFKAVYFITLQKPDTKAKYHICYSGKMLLPPEQIVLNFTDRTTNKTKIMSLLANMNLNIQGFYNEIKEISVPLATKLSNLIQEINGLTNLLTPNEVSTLETYFSLKEGSLNKLVY